MTATNEGASPIGMAAITGPQATPPASTVPPVMASTRLGRVRTYVTYGGTVSACVVAIWIKDKTTGNYYRGAATNSPGMDPLTGTKPEVRDWRVGEQTQFIPVVETLTGTNPTVTISIEGVV